MYLRGLLRTCHFGYPTFGVVFSNIVLHQLHQPLRNITTNISTPKMVTPKMTGPEQVPYAPLVFRWAYG